MRSLFSIAPVIVLSWSVSLPVLAETRLAQAFEQAWQRQPVCGRPG